MNNRAALSQRRNRFDIKGALFGLSLLALVILLVIVGAQFAPTYLGKQKMEEAAAEIVQRAAHQNLELENVRAQLREKAREYQLPEACKIEVTRDGRAVTARIEYDTTIQLPGTTYPWPIRLQIRDLGY